LNEKLAIESSAENLTNEKGLDRLTDSNQAKAAMKPKDMERSIIKEAGPFFVITRLR